MTPWYFILGPLAFCILGLVVCKFGEAIDHWKKFNDPLDFILTVVGTILWSSVIYGFYLLILKK
jgi:hypothetical protein